MKREREIEKEEEKKERKKKERKTEAYNPCFVSTYFYMKVHVK